MLLVLVVTDQVNIFSLNVTTAVVATELYVVLSVGLTEETLGGVTSPEEGIHAAPNFS